MDHSGKKQKLIEDQTRTWERPVKAKKKARTYNGIRPDSGVTQTELGC